jgi:hypothetical protein
MIDEALPSRAIEVKLQPPLTLPGFDLIANYFLQKLAGEPALDLAVNLILLPAGLGLIPFHREAAQGLQDLAEAGTPAVQLLAGQGGGVLQYAQVFLAVHQKFFGRRSHPPGCTLLQGGSCSTAPRNPTGA